MSFSSKVKKELCTKTENNRHCNIAEITGIINTCGNIFVNIKTIEVKIQTENPTIAKKYFTLIKKVFGINCNVSVKKSNQFKKNRVYYISLLEDSENIKVLSATGIIMGGISEETGISKMLDMNLNRTIIKSECCKRSYIRGAFLAGGSLSSPEKSYHLEFVNARKKMSEDLKEIINFYGLNAKLIFRKGSYVVYLKEAENIADILNIMGAHISLMDLVNVRILKDMRNNINRRVNCETANLSKTIDASISQIADIQYIYENMSFGVLSEQLEEVAKLRLLHPEATLKEIGAMLSPAVGKSGVNHRLRKISSIAENLKGGQI